ncbi:MAG: ectonucleotide pyrophosphatase/phosphodiesterase [Candidatus Neomarinimicrobiota bacterium]
MLISFDGFRWDYLEKTLTPNLDRFIATGVKAEALMPVFPTTTYPNHYTIVTGLYPTHHGLTANYVHDPALGGYYHFATMDTGINHSQWWEAKPIWVTAEEAGLITASVFWPGSTVEFGGTQATYSLDPNDRYKLSHEARIDQVLAGFDLPDNTRPRLITMYFPDTDVRGHQFGPESQTLALTVRGLDYAMGYLFQGLEERGLMEEIDIIIVSDHGMTQLSSERLIFLDDYIDIPTAGIINWSTFLTLWPGEQIRNHVFAALDGAHPALHMYRTETLPPRFHYQGHRRIPPILGLIDEGWHIMITRAGYAADPSQLVAGGHGYDPALRSMWGIFMARGPSFKSGLVVEPFQNIHVYELIAHLLGVQPEPNDGSLDEVKIMLAE